MIRDGVDITSILRTILNTVQHGKLYTSQPKDPQVSVQTVKDCVHEWIYFRKLMIDLQDMRFVQLLQETGAGNGIGLPGPVSTQDLN